MPIHIRRSGVWTEIDAAGIRVGGTWRTPNAVAIRTGGAWRKAWPPSTLSLSTISRSQGDSVGPIVCGVRFNSDGSIDERGPALATYTQINVGEWSTDEPATTGARYEVRCASISSGAWDVAAAATGVWIALSADRIWSVTRTVMEGSGVDTCIATFEIREINYPTNQVSATVTVSAEIF